MTALRGNRLIVANWKMNGLRRDGLDRARTLVVRASATPPKGCEIVLCPPSTLLHEIRGALDGSAVQLGAQDCHQATHGAFTGDVSAAMLADVGCRYVIVGHSERRAGHAERDADVAAKALAAVSAGLTPIICVGERREERDSGQALTVIEAQVRASVPSSLTLPFVLAYEPIWAIGSGRTPTTAEIEAVHALVWRVLNDHFSGTMPDVRVLYGGSVGAKNAPELLAIRGVHGALVGGASLSVEDFWAICAAAGRLDVAA
ncbi:MAG: triose-phosphate isomerase [Alphaproteobacteria bacterium]|nr:triose-phosphate isomerase [Alphaproteobacteria bacterium]